MTGFARTRQLVETLNNDKNRLMTMTPTDHLRWVKSLPAMQLCTSTSASVQQGIGKLLTHNLEEIIAQRKRSWQYWSRRKIELQQSWRNFLENAPETVRSVLGEDKNIFLLREMLEAAGAEDLRVCEELIQGFALMGILEQFFDVTRPAGVVAAPPKPTQTLDQKWAMKRRTITRNKSLEERQAF